MYLINRKIRRKMINILPINDLKEHIEESTCECHPSLIIENGEMIFIHNSYDGRENQEINPNS
jgi:hypothetical protein